MAQWQTINPRGSGVGGIIQAGDLITKSLNNLGNTLSRVGEREDQAFKENRAIEEKFKADTKAYNKELEAKAKTEAEDLITTGLITARSREELKQYYDTIEQVPGYKYVNKAKVIENFQKAEDKLITKEIKDNSDKIYREAINNPKLFNKVTGTYDLSSFSNFSPETLKEANNKLEFAARNQAKLSSAKEGSDIYNASKDAITIDPTTGMATKFDEAVLRQGLMDSGIPLEKHDGIVADQRALFEENVERQQKIQIPQLAEASIGTDKQLNEKEFIKKLRGINVPEEQIPGIIKTQLGLMYADDTEKGILAERLKTKEARDVETKAKALETKIMENPDAYFNTDGSLKRSEIKGNSNAVISATEARLKPAIEARKQQAKVNKEKDINTISAGPFISLKDSIDKYSKLKNVTPQEAKELAIKDYDQDFIINSQNKISTAVQDIISKYADKDGTITESKLGKFRQASNAAGIDKKITEAAINQYKLQSAAITDEQLNKNKLAYAAHVQKGITDKTIGTADWVVKGLSLNPDPEKVYNDSINFTQEGKKLERLPVKENKEDFDAYMGRIDTFIENMPNKDAEYAKVRLIYDNAREVFAHPDVYPKTMAKLDELGLNQAELKNLFDRAFTEAGFWSMSGGQVKDSVLDGFYSTFKDITSKEKKETQGSITKNLITKMREAEEKNNKLPGKIGVSGFRYKPRKK